MTVLRDVNTSSGDFRRILREVTFYLGYEATRTLPVSKYEVQTPMQQTYEGAKLSESVTIIPILRAGLGMCDAMLDLMPKARVHHIGKYIHFLSYISFLLFNIWYCFARWMDFTGMYRSKGSLLPVQYYNKLPKEHPTDIVYIIDPCIATSNTIHAVTSIVKKWGAKKIVVIAAIGSREGVDKVIQLHPDVDLYVAAIDEVLSPQGYLLPGIGDAGDRLFGTPHYDAVGDVEITLHDEHDAAHEEQPESASPSKKARK
jgi:uracil phosphoribosyltransferase